MFLKIDLLGLQTLRLIEKTIENVIKHNYVDICIEDEKFRLKRGTKIRLTSGDFVNVEDLKPDDDVEMSLSMHRRGNT